MRLCIYLFIYMQMQDTRILAHMRNVQKYAE